jgi:hypothetical protein
MISSGCIKIKFPSFDRRRIPDRTCACVPSSSCKPIELPKSESDDYKFLSDFGVDVTAEFDVLRPPVPLRHGYSLMKLESKLTG